MRRHRDECLPVQGLDRDPCRNCDNFFPCSGDSLFPVPYSLFPLLYNSRP
ncbi:hypothetical protein [Moorena producens]